MYNPKENEEHVILVNQQDEQIGLMPKLEAHQKGLLHRAFSVFIFNTKGEMLLQKRAAEKYHSPGLWSNACCSHPRMGEKAINGATRRLKEEMGIECQLTAAFNFIYKAEFENGLTEHEFDYVFVGKTDALPNLDKLEVQDWKYMDMDALAADIAGNPDNYTQWLKIAFDRVAAQW